MCSFLLFHLKENCIILEVLWTVLTQRARELTFARMAHVVLGGAVLVILWVVRWLDGDSRACFGSVPWFIQFKLELL